MEVLGIDVDESLLRRWREWLMPVRQPFIVAADTASDHGWADARGALSSEVADAFELYGVPTDDRIVLLDRQQARTLPRETRADQPARHRWPTGSLDGDVRRAVRFVERGCRASRHREVAPSIWEAAAPLLPAARRLAGTFPAGSGPNCFGAVMAAAGVEGAETVWMQVEPFETWLADSTSPGGRDDRSGTVLVWRDADGVPTHAAVTLGGGWLLHKPSQGWMSPTMVLSVAEGKSASRARGRRLHRRTLLRR